MKTSEGIAEIAKALSDFQANVKQPEKDGNNPHFKSKYVTLDGTVKAIHECAPKYGLSYSQMPVSDENGVGVVTVIFHQSGQFIEFDPFILPLDKKTAQGVGSALTYSKRYALSAAFGIVSDVDDDGNEATSNAPVGKQTGEGTLLSKWKLLGGKEEEFASWYESQRQKYNNNQIDVYLTKKMQAKENKGA
jgi:hypothetical protein